MLRLTDAEVYPSGLRDVAARQLTLANGLRVRIAESGSRVSGRPPVVMLHGWGASMYMYRHAHRRLSELRLRVLSVDLRGHGLSDKPQTPGSYTLDAFCEDLAALLDAVAEGPVSLVGQSMGGGIALRFAQRHPHRVHNLALINPTGLVSVAWVTTLGSLAPQWLIDTLGERAIPRSLVKLILQRVAFGDPSCVSERDVDEYWATTQQPGYAHAVRATLSDFDWSPFSADEASRLDIPTAVILGTEDRLVRDARDAASRIAGARVHSLRGGHCVHEERPEEVYQLLGDFITARH